MQLNANNNVLFINILKFKIRFGNRPNKPVPEIKIYLIR